MKRVVMSQTDTIGIDELEKSKHEYVVYFLEKSTAFILMSYPYDNDNWCWLSPRDGQIGLTSPSLGTAIKEMVERGREVYCIPHSEFFSFLSRSTEPTNIS